MKKNKRVAEDEVEAPLNPWSTTVLYGPSGAGKTTLAATAPKPVFLDSNQGTMSVRGRDGFKYGRVDVFGMDDLDAAYDKLTGTAQNADWSRKYDTIIFDHFDDIQSIIMENLGDKRAAKDSRKDEDEAEQRDYGIMGSKLKRYIRRFKKVDKHKILICAEKEDRDQGRLGPAVIGQMRAALPYFADHTFYLRIGKKNKRYLHLDSTDEFYAKTRAWWLPPELRKQEIPFDDPKFLSHFFALIAAGPQKTSSKAARKDT